MGMDIEREIKASGIEWDHHESDLYVRDVPEAWEIIRLHPLHYANAKVFWSADEVPSRRWVDIPFAYGANRR